MNNTHQIKNTSTKSGSTLTDALDGITGGAGGTNFLETHFEAYGPTLSLAITTTATLTYSTVRHDSSGDFSESSGHVTIENAGTYLVVFKAEAGLTTGTSRSASETWLEIDLAATSGESWTEYAATRGQHYNREVNEDATMHTNVSLLTAAAGDSVRVRGVRSSGAGAPVLVANHCSLVILRIF